MGVATDGDVSSQPAQPPAAGRELYLRGQPRNGRVRGVSFFVPASPALCETVYPRKLEHGCSVTPLNHPLPPGFKFVNDAELQVHIISSVTGLPERTVCGQHWTLFTDEDMLPDDFVRRYEQLLSLCLPCTMTVQGATTNSSPVTPSGSAQASSAPSTSASPTPSTRASTSPSTPASTASPRSLPVQLDDVAMPADWRTLVSVMALEDLADDDTAGPNVRFFAYLYALHFRALDREFAEVVNFTPAVAAAALEAYTVHDPQLMVPAMDAQDALAAELGYQPKRPGYKPFWEVQPFCFLDGRYTDDLYKRQVAVAAPAYKRDQALQNKVRAVAEEAFAGMQAGWAAVVETSFQHSRVRITVKCGIQSGQLCSPA